MNSGKRTSPRNTRIGPVSGRPGKTWTEVSDFLIGIERAEIYTKSWCRLGRESTIPTVKFIQNPFLQAICPFYDIETET